MVTTDLKIQKASKSRINEVDFSNLGFGTEVTDHMYVADYNRGVWAGEQIVPFSNLTLAPTTLALHYGQTVFEGMKAFRTVDGNISIFRLAKHQQRFNHSLQRMCMPELSREMFDESVCELVSLEQEWLKRGGADVSMYIRPFMFATELRFGVKASEEFKYIVFTGAVGEYFAAPLRLKVEDSFVRASKGGTGTAKCGGNYGGAFYPTQQAKKEGFDQLIWTDGSEELNIEESGMMNIVLVIDGEVCTPPLSDTILSGVTRDSILCLASDMGYTVRERKISAYEIREKIENGKLTEAFGTGTAAVTAPIACINIQGKDCVLPAQSENSFRHKVSTRLNAIRIGAEEDKFGWNTIL